MMVTLHYGQVVVHVTDRTIHHRMYYVVVALIHQLVLHHVKLVPTTHMLILVKLNVMHVPITRMQHLEQHPSLTVYVMMVIGANGLLVDHVMPMVRVVLLLVVMLLVLLVVMNPTTVTVVVTPQPVNVVDMMNVKQFMLIIVPLVDGNSFHVSHDNVMTVQ